MLYFETFTVIVFGFVLLNIYILFQRIANTNNSLKETQIDLIISLIKSIDSSEYLFVHQKSIGSEIINCFRASSGNIFEFANLSSHILDEYDIYTSSVDLNVKAEFFKFLQHPLTPNKIVSCIEKIGDFKMSMRDIDKLNDVIVLGKKKNKENNSKVRITSKYNGNFKDFRNACSELKFEIVKWLNENGIKDINNSIINRKKTIL